MMWDLTIRKGDVYGLIGKMAQGKPPSSRSSPSWFQETGRKRLPLFFHESLPVDPSPETGRICHRESCGSQAYDRLSKPSLLLQGTAISPIPTRSSKKPWTMSAWIIRVRRNSAIFHSGWNNGWELPTCPHCQARLPHSRRTHQWSLIQSESREFRQMIKRLNDELGMTILISSHIPLWTLSGCQSFWYCRPRTPDQRN